MISRRIEATLRQRLTSSAAVVLLGPRQIGKTTLARKVAREWPAGSIYLDLERPADLRRMEDADAFLRAQAPKLVVLDEVHRIPRLFEILRGVVDHNRETGFRFGQFLLLGSASLDLIHISSESLAGRVAHLDLAGIDVAEAAAAHIDEDTLWLRGGYPEALLADNDRDSFDWRTDLIRSYLERDVPMFAPRIPAQTLRRLWTMLAHDTGGLLNAARLAAGIGVSGPAVDRYLDLLADLDLVRRLRPWHANVGKRLVKSPKVLVRDTGLLHALLDIDDLYALLGHPVAGPSFETLAVESLINAAEPRLHPYHFRTATGDRIDLLLVRADEPAISVEVKRSTSPTLSSGYHRAAALLDVPNRYVVIPDDGLSSASADPFTLRDGTQVVGLAYLTELLASGRLPG